jgi:succinate-semialdehyde dehydrogenase/glutarate-semialdehyde dehydrogenase
MTDKNELAPLFIRASAAQADWGARSLDERSKYLHHLKDSLIGSKAEVAKLISEETGKPYFEAVSNEVLVSIHAVALFANNLSAVLSPKRVPMSFVIHRKSHIEYFPLGTVLILSPWNYPWMMPFMECLMAVAAGNAVILKPSEITPRCGFRIQQLFENAGFPIGLVQCVTGGPEIGQALIKNHPAKIFLTGSPEAGRRVLAAAAEKLIPVSLELGGKNALVILPDVDIDFATSMALWGTFSNLGQMCASIERIFIHEKIKNEFTSMLKEKISKLRQNSPNEPGDLGRVILPSQMDRYLKHIENAHSLGLSVDPTPHISKEKLLFSPTLIEGEKIFSSLVYNEETFGPIASVVTFKTHNEVIGYVNDSRFGLMASILTRDSALGQILASQFKVGTVVINEVGYVAGLADVPWGGIKDSGYSRSHSLDGLLNFVNTRHVHQPLHPALTHKSLWAFPYTPTQLKLFEYAAEFFRTGILNKLSAIPPLIYTFVKFIKNDRRL